MEVSLSRHPDVTDEGVETLAVTLVNSLEFKEIIRQLKAAVIRDWSVSESAAGRDALWHDLQAIGRLEGLVYSLRNSAVIRKRKAEAK